MKRFSYSRYFAEINTLADLQFMPAEKPYIDRPAASERKDLLLYLGCNVLRTAHLAKTVIAILRAMRFDFNVAGGPAHCCGIVHHQHNSPQRARALGASNVRHFAQYGAKTVVMWCPSCIEHYDDVVAKTQTLGFSYEHVTSFIARHRERITYTGRLEKRIALHSHDGDAQSQFDRDSTKQVLRAIPGLELIELESAAMTGRHCNPKWISGVGRVHWQKCVSYMLKAATDARVDVLATIYHSCQREICAEERNHSLSVINYISLLGEAMGIVYPDMYKRYKLSADPDAIFKEVQPYVAANGLDSARVRATLRSAFAPACEPDESNPS